MERKINGAGEPARTGEPVGTRELAGIRKPDRAKEPAGTGEPGKPAGSRRHAFPGKWRYGAVLLLLGVCCMAGAVGGIYAGREKENGKKEGLVYEANIVMGDIPGKTREERQRELDSIVEEGMIALSINATPSGKTSGADRSVNWLIENPSNQRKLIRVEVTLDETGEKIYETGAIPPGSYVEEAPPDVKLEAGIYECTAMFYAYREEDEEYIGQAAAQLKLPLLE